MADTVFYTLAKEALSKECKRLCDLTDAMDKDPVEKKKRIAEYKCLKYRYASVANIENAIHHNNRCRKLHNLKDYHHLLLPFDEIFKMHIDYVALYDSAPEEEKPDYSLYYAITTFADQEIEKLTNKSEFATDWEKIELEERIGGFRFAKECLTEAWEKRKDVEK